MFESSSYSDIITDDEFSDEQTTRKQVDEKSNGRKLNGWSHVRRGRREGD